MDRLRSGRPTAPGGVRRFAGVRAAALPDEGTRIHCLTTSLRENPEPAVCLTLALGFLIGKARLGSFTLRFSTS